MEKKYAFRDYKRDDYPGVLDLWEKTGLGNEFRGDDSDIIELSLKLGGKLIIMEEKITKSVIGTSWMTFDGRRIHLHHFGISPEYQGKGLSKLLLKKSLTFAKEKGFQIKLEVHEKNKIAINLYKKFFFKYLGDYRIYIIRDLNDLDI